MGVGVSHVLQGQASVVLLGASRRGPWEGGAGRGSAVTSVLWGEQSASPTEVLLGGPGPSSWDHTPSETSVPRCPQECLDQCLRPFRIRGRSVQEKGPERLCKGGVRITSIAHNFCQKDMGSESNSV